MRIPQIISGLSLICLLAACAGQGAPDQGNQGAANQAGQNQGTQTQSMHQQAAGGHEHDQMTVIPSVDRDKKLTTNRHGGTNSGMGTATYSRMGSSGLLDGGPSTNLESQLAAAGVNGVQVLVVHDSVFIAPADGKTLSVNQMDETQSHVLSNYRGSSQRGTQFKDGQVGTLGTSDRDGLLAQAKDQLERIYGGGVQIRTVTQPQAIAALERIKQSMGGARQLDPNNASTTGISGTAGNNRTTRTAGSTNAAGNANLAQDLALLLRSASPGGGR
ncbi:hypothetical protein KDJ56_21075 [Brevibacillus composti]|uniref:Sporulation protein n=1 Tax=Brevibacillus composti TaxID=2796470 RepID=A0A7T5JNP4_9BACL|nr:hypothetical protein [Brevibacillus composti]QQE74297.1 hypothetical protein JD108_21140 [Brevibacillus composti]QUO41379.1 hypothetical protein KDJ56_21075 [Brevibacillus composti]